MRSLLLIKKRDPISCFCDKQVAVGHAALDARLRQGGGRSGDGGKPDQPHDPLAVEPVQMSWAALLAAMHRVAPG